MDRASIPLIAVQDKELNCDLQSRAIASRRHGPFWPFARQASIRNQADAPNWLGLTLNPWISVSTRREDTRSGRSDRRPSGNGFAEVGLIW